MPGLPAIDEKALILLTLGMVLLVAVAVHFIGRKLPLPQVTLLILAGVVIGPSGFDLLPEEGQHWYPLIASSTLLMVGFLLGGKLSLDILRKNGRKILWFSAFEVLGAAVLVFSGLVVVGVDPALALLFAGIAPASAPAATMGVVRETEAQGPFTDTLLGVVAIDDAWGLMLFSFLLAIAGAIGSEAGALSVVLGEGAYELFGALLLGLLFGIPTAFLTKRIRAGEALETEALGVVLVCGGLALWLDVSFLLSIMVVGAAVVNIAGENGEPFQIIETFEWPLMVIFFVLSGASLQITDLWHIGGIGAAYILLRSAGLILGAWLGGRFAKAERLWCRWMGWALLPQAGVALGMALIAATHFPDHKNTILSIVIGSTVIFELTGPIFTRVVLHRVGEARD